MLYKLLYTANQVLIWGTLFNFLGVGFIWSAFGWICGCGTHRYRGPTVYRKDTRNLETFTQCEKEDLFHIVIVPLWSQNQEGSAFLFL